ncbi:MAG: redoxin domain-containing protein [Sulfurimonas sp.]
MKAFVIFLLASVVTFGSEFYMLDFKMHSLYKKDQVVDLNTFKGKRLFLMFIKSDCKWCEKQVKAFNKLLKSEHAKELAVVAVTLGDDTELLKAKTKSAEYPVVRASKYLLESIGGVKMTPYTLVADKQGNFETKIVGYQTAAQIESIIHKLEGKN